MVKFWYNNDGAGLLVFMIHVRFHWITQGSPGNGNVDIFLLMVCLYSVLRRIGNITAGYFYNNRPEIVCENA